MLRCAAVVIQSAVRCVGARQRLRYLLRSRNELFQASVTIQKNWRMFLAQLQFRATLRGVLRLQALVRKRMAVNSYVSIVLAIVQAQAAARRFLALRQRDYTQNALLCLQRFAKRIISRGKARAAHEMLTKYTTAATILQRHWRGFSTFIKYRLVLLDIVNLQKAARRWGAIRIANRRRNATGIMQLSVRNFLVRQRWQRYRKALACKRVRENAAVTQMQAVFRAFLIRRELQLLSKCAVAIQTQYRAYQGRLSFLTDILDIVLVQAIIRRRACRSSFLHLKASAECIQRSQRICAANDTLASLKRSRNECFAALTIQSACRRYAAWKMMGLFRQQVAILKIQRVFRGSQCRQIACFMRESWRSKRSAILLQSVYRSYFARQQVQSRHHANERIRGVLLLQRFIRGQKVRQETAERLTKLRQNYGVVHIQKLYRGRRDRRLAQREMASRMIQKTWRCYSVHVDYMLSFLAVIHIQKSLRRKLGARIAARRFEALGVLQHFFRQSLYQMRKQRGKTCAIIIQTTFRRRTAMAKMALLCKAATIIQRWSRGFLARINLDLERFAAMEIQRTWRGSVAYLKYVWILLSTIKIQASVRAFQARERTASIRLTRKKLELQRRVSALKIQLVFRRFTFRKRKSRAADTIRMAFRLHISKRAFSRLRYSTILLQSAVRRLLTQRRQPKRIRSQASRIQLANERAEADPRLRLGFRTQAALEALTKSTRLAEIMMAICTLETATRYSEKCCIAFAQAGAPATLFDLIRTCNRSLPHVELLHRILQTMWNVAKYKGALPSMATLTGVEVFLDLVQMFRDKDGVFCLAVSLLERVVRHGAEFQVSVER